jgi:hypothetical protein
VGPKAAAALSRTLNTASLLIKLTLGVLVIVASGRFGMRKEFPLSSGDFGTLSF